MLSYITSLLTSVWTFVSLDQAFYNVYYGYRLLAVLCIINYISYLILEQILSRTFPKFNDLTYAEKKYTVKNLSKSCVLLYILITLSPMIYNIIFNGVWDNEKVHFYGTLYASTDVTGLLLVPNLAKATKIHHITVWVFSTLNMISNHEINGLHRALIVLGFFSVIPYIVNTYLGLRHLDTPYIKNKIVDIALFSYVNSVIANITLQHLYVFRWVSHFNIFSLIYISLYYLILYDDIKLIKYLYHKYRKGEHVVVVVENPLTNSPRLATL